MYIENRIWMYLSYKWYLSHIAHSGCRVAGSREGDQTKLPESNYGSHVLSQTSLSDQEKNCIALLSNGLAGQPKEDVNPSAGKTPANGAASVQLKNSRIARIRDKNRRAQQKYRERKKVQHSQMLEEFESRKRKLSFLRAENKKLVGVGHVLSHSFSLRKVLLGEKKLEKNIKKTHNYCVHECPKAQDSVQRIKDSKKVLMARETVDVCTFKEKILDEFWKISNDSVAFLQQIAYGTILEDNCKASIAAFKDLVLSMIQSSHSRDLIEAVHILDRLSNGFEKVIFRAEYIGSRMLDSPGSVSQLSLISHLQCISQSSGIYIQEYVSLFKILEKVFSPEQYARIWIESPTFAVPDALQILHWINESFQGGIPTKE